MQNQTIRRLRAWALAGAGCVAAFGFGGQALAHGVNWAVGVGMPGVSVGVSNGGAMYVGAQPVYAAPPVVYAPPPVAYAPPPVAYAPAPVAYAPPPVYYGPSYYRAAPVVAAPVFVGGGWGHFRHHHHWR